MALLGFNQFLHLFVYLFIIVGVHKVLDVIYDICFRLVIVKSVHKNYCGG